MAFELTPWRPFRELAPFREFKRMRREMDRLWDSFLERSPGREEAEWLPALDVSETKDEIVVKAEVPGMEAKDIDISLSGDVLTIKGQKKQEKKQKDENYHMSERSDGAFFRSVRLPQEVQGDKVAAQYKDGVLKINLPKSEKAKAKEIKIKAE